MVLIPPLKVYIQINTIVVATVTINGTFHASKRNNCSTVAARYKSERRSDRSRDEEKECSSLIGPEAETLLEECIDRNKIQPVVQRHQNADDHPITDQISHHYLEISESDLAHITRNGDKRDP